MGFKVHAHARITKTELTKTTLRSAGHAIAVGHMKEHAMICSDYAIKTVQLAFPDDIEKIKKERLWLLDKLIKVDFKNINN